MTEPRLYQWSEMGNQTRGLLEHLVHYDADGSFTPVLLEGWEINDDATQYTLKLRQGIKWNNGDDFTSADVAANIEGWCDTSIEGNSVATRMGPLVAPAGTVARSCVSESTAKSDTGVPLKLIAVVPPKPEPLQHRVPWRRNPRRLLSRVRVQIGTL